MSLNGNWAPYGPVCGTPPGSLSVSVQDGSTIVSSEKLVRDSMFARPAAVTVELDSFLPINVSVVGWIRIPSRDPLSPAFEFAHLHVRPLRTMQRDQLDQSVTSLPSTLPTRLAHFANVTDPSPPVRITVSVSAGSLSEADDLLTREASPSTALAQFQVAFQGLQGSTVALQLTGDAGLRIRAATVDIRLALCREGTRFVVPQGGHGTCELCYTGHFSSSRGMTNCELCPPGRLARHGAVRTWAYA